MLTLEEFTAPLLAKVPIDPEVSMVFTRRNCPAPPAELETDQLLIKTHPLSSRYGASVWRDDVRFFAEKPTLRSLGLLTLSHVLHPDRETVIHVRHLQTHATKLVISCPSPYFGNLQMKPMAYEYCPAVPEYNQPLYHDRLRAVHGPSNILPCVVLTNEDDNVNRPDELRTVIQGFGSVEGSTLIAALLLDIGLPQNDEDEFKLESAPGYQSVSHHSAEVRFFVSFNPSMWGFRSAVESP